MIDFSPNPNLSQPYLLANPENIEWLKNKVQEANKCGIELILNYKVATKDSMPILREDGKRLFYSIGRSGLIPSFGAGRIYLGFDEYN